MTEEDEKEEQQPDAPAPLYDTREEKEEAYCWPEPEEAG